MRVAAFTVMLLLLAGCYKDEVVIADLVTNPFDPDYGGVSVVVFDSTFLTTIAIGDPPQTITVQAVQVHLRTELLPPGQDTDLRFTDPVAAAPVLVQPLPGTSVYRYLRSTVEPGVPRCYGVALFNDLSAARTDTICCTLQ